MPISTEGRGNYINAHIHWRKGELFKCPYPLEEGGELFTCPYPLEEGGELFTCPYPLEEGG